MRDVETLEQLADSLRHHEHLKQIALGCLGAAVLIVLLASLIP